MRKIILWLGMVLLVIGAFYYLSPQEVNAPVLQEMTEEVTQETTQAPIVQSNPTPESLKAEPFETMTLRNKEDQELLLKDLSDKPKLVMFWASWCPDCQATMKVVHELYTRYQTQADFIMVNLVDSRESKDTGVQYIRDNIYLFDYYYDQDGALAKQVGVYAIPTLMFFNADGTYRSAVVGTQTQEGLEPLVQDLIRTGGK